MANLAFKKIFIFTILISYFADSRYLKIVDTYERIFADLSEYDKIKYVELFKAHINMLKRVDMPKIFDEEDFDDVMCQSLFNNATSCQSPIALYLGGGTASGKSSITKIWEPVVNQECGYVHIDPDAIMMEMPKWKSIINSSNTKCAATELHSNASMVASKCFVEAVNKNFTVVYDGTMSSYKKTMDQIQLTLERGYELQMFGVTVDTTIAAERAWDRAQNSSRYVPLCVIYETHRGYAAYYSEYIAIIEINQLFDSTSFLPDLIAMNGKVLKQNLFNEFYMQSKQSLSDVENEMNSTILADYNDLDQECSTCSLASKITVAIPVAIVLWIIMILM